MSWRDAIGEPTLRKLAARGGEGAAWLTRLDDEIASLAEAWDLSLHEPLSGGSEALILAATTAEGRAAVLKVGIPGSDAGAHEASVLAAAAGRGYADVLRVDAGRRAMLLERLGPSLATLGLSIDAQIEALATTLREAWMPPPTGVSFMDGAERAQGLAEFIAMMWAKLDAPCSARTVEMALGCAKTRGAAFDPRASVLAHGDPHAANALLAGADGPKRFKFVDPDGIFIEPAYDLGVVMRGWNADLAGEDAVAIARDRSRKLSALTSVDAQAIWEWSIIERTSTGLLLHSLGPGPEAAEYLAAVEALAAGE